MTTLAEMYDQKYSTEQWLPLTLRPNAVSTTRYDDVARLLQGHGGSLLEVGCGAGQLLAALGNQFDRLVGVDLSKSRVELGRSEIVSRFPELEGKINLFEGSADSPLPFDTGFFDVVVACAVVEHVVDVFHTMDEIARVCRPGGCCVITVPNICYIRHIRDLLLGRVPQTGTPTRDVAYWRVHGWDGGHFHYFSRKTLGDLLKNCGFTPKEWTGDGKLAKYRRWYINLVGSLTVRALRNGTP